MAVLEQINNGDVGIKKEIDEGAIDLVFQAIQEDMYSYPIKSFVRETISNGLDAVTERNIALKILDGEPEENYYEQRQDGKLLKDSGFNVEYYDRDYLSSRDFIDVKYKEGNNRDTISVTDRGVGLGGSRLKGFFKLGFSSKRNMKDVIGKFGAGAKAGLATGVEFFTMETTYEGYRTKFMIYKTDYEPVTMEKSDGKEERWTVQMANGETQVRSIFWEPTIESNGVTITLEVKKHNSQAFISAVKEQFLYFKDRVRFTYPQGYYDKTVKTEMLNANPYYESDNIIIPESSPYYAPHILVDGICYGNISWDELEMERRRGELAIRVRATDVDITQSRETLKWTSKTKDTIKEAIKRAKNEAKAHVSKKALEGEDDDAKDLLSINNRYAKLRKSSADKVTRIFSEFLDMSDIKPKAKFTIDDVEMNHELTDELFELIFYKHDVYTVSLNGKRISKNRVKSFNNIANSILVQANTSALGPKKAQSIMDNNDIESFVYIRPNNTRLRDEVTFNDVEFNTFKVGVWTHKLLYTRALQLDTMTFEFVEDVDDEDNLDGASVTSGNALAKLRRLNKEVFYRQKYITGMDSYGVDSRENSNLTVKIADIRETFDKEDIETVLCTSKYKDLGLIVEAGKYYSGTHKKVNTRVIYVAEPIVKHFAPYCTFITDYFNTFNPETKEVMLGQELRSLNTMDRFYKLLKGRGHYANKMQLMKKLLENTNVDDYKARLEGRNSNLDEVFSKALKSDVSEEIRTYLEKLAVFQDVVADGSPEEIAAKAKECFNTEDVLSVEAYDKEFIDTLEAELKRFDKIEPLLNQLDISHYQGVNEKAIELLKEFIIFKNQETC